MRIGLFWGNVNRSDQDSLSRGFDFRSQGEAVINFAPVFSRLKLIVALIQVDKAFTKWYDFLTLRKEFLTMEIRISSASDVEALLLKLVKQASSEDLDCVVEAQTVPLLDVKGFDSLSALEVLTELEEGTGIHVDEDIFYVDASPKKYLSIHEVSLAVWGLVLKGGKHDG